MKLGAPAVLAALLALAGACAPSPKAPSELVFWPLAPVAAVEPAVRAFEAANPGWRVRVQARPPVGAADSLAAVLGTIQVPDLCEVEGRDMPGLLASGTLVDWSAGVADQRARLRGWDLCRVGDALYGLPWRLSARMLFWNPALLARAGIDTTRAPGTWDALVAAAARVQRLGRGVHGYGLALGDSGVAFPGFISFAWPAGGEVLSAGLDSSRFDCDGNVAALELLSRLRRTALLAPQGALDSAFAAGRLGLLVADSRTADRLARVAPSLRFRVDAVPSPPATPDSILPYGDGDVLVSFTQARHKEQALRLARFLAAPDQAAAVVAAGADGVPSAAGAESLAVLATRPLTVGAARSVSRARFAPGHPAWSDMQLAIEHELGEALRGAKTARQAVADAGARLAALVGHRAPQHAPTAAAAPNGGNTP